VSDDAYLKYFNKKVIPPAVTKTDPQPEDDFMIIDDVTAESDVVY